MNGPYPEEITKDDMTGMLFIDYWETGFPLFYIYGNHQKCNLYVTPKGDSLYGIFHIPRKSPGMIPYVEGIPFTDY